MKRVPIEKHPGFWRRGDKVVFKYRDHRRRQRWGSARTVAEAKKLRAALLTDVDRGEYRQRSSDTFDGYARSWVETYQGRTRKRIEEHTRDGYRRVLELDAIPYFEGMRLTDVQPQDVKAFAAHVASRPRARKRKGEPETGLSPNSVRLALAPVKAMLATAFEEGLIRTNPAAGLRIVVPRDVDDVDLDDDTDGDVKALAPAEVAAFFEQLRTNEEWARWQLFFRTLLELGLRIGEAIELRWKDVDLGERKVRIRRKFYRGSIGRPKSKYGRRTLKVPADLATELWTLRKETRAGDDELVFTTLTGQRVDQSNLMGRVLKKATIAAGIGGWVGFHTFRHTCATERFKAGWNPKQVQLWLGHHKASFTVDTYVHLLDEDLPEPASIAPRGTQSGTSEPEKDAKTEIAAAL